MTKILYDGHPTDKIDLKNVSQALGMFFLYISFMLLTTMTKILCDGHPTDIVIGLPETSRSQDLDTQTSES